MNREFSKNCGESKYRKEIRAFNSGRDYERQRLMDENKSAYLAELSEQKRQIQLERYKLQTEKLENNKWLRECARDEMIMEKIIEAIKETKPEYVMPAPIPVGQDHGAWALLFGDAHFGKKFVIYGLDGEVLNEYSEEIFYDRMNRLLSETIAIVTKEKIDTLHVFDLGDNTDGILRVSQLMTLKYGVIESAVRYANYLVQWLDMLSRHVHIKFAMASGNHTELRMLGQPRGTFKGDNMVEVIKTIISIRLDNNPNFEMLNNPTGFIFAEMAGFNILGVHGECGNLEKAIGEFSNTYKKQIDFMVGGHFHHGKTEDVGRKRGVISVRSIIGIDDFSMSLNRTADAGASIVCFEEGKGNTVVRNVCLN